MSHKSQASLAARKLRSIYVWVINKFRQNGNLNLIEADLEQIEAQQFYPDLSRLHQMASPS